MDKQFILVGVITGAHGITGEVKIKSFMTQAEDIGKYDILYDENKNNFKIKKFKGNSKNIIFKIIDIDDRNKAEALRGTKLYINKKSLPQSEDDEFYHHDLIGLSAITNSGGKLGIVKGLHNFGAGDLIEIELQDKSTEFFSFSKEVVAEINIAEQYIVITPPEEI